jgi:hypothetical protein
VTLLAALAALLLQTAPDISSEPACRPAETIRATVREIGRDPGRFVERCVRVSGLLYHGILHDDRASLYLARRNSWDGGPLRSSPIHHLRVDGPLLRTLDNEMPVPASVTGRIDTCAQRHRRHERWMLMHSGPDDIVIAPSHCYGRDGQLILVSDLSVRRGRVERVIGEPARVRIGNLMPMPDDFPSRARYELLTAQFLAALRAGDRERAGMIHGIRPGSRDSRSEATRNLLAYLFADPNSPFADFRRSPPSQIAWFVPRLDDAERFAGGHHAAIACFCRTRDCRDRWPISSIDIRHQPGRPYACTRLFAREWVPGGAELETDPVPTGPVEPQPAVLP